MSNDYFFRDHYFLPQTGRLLGRCKSCRKLFITTKQGLIEGCIECDGELLELTDDEYVEAALGPGVRKGPKTLSDVCKDFDRRDFPEAQEELETRLLECVEMFGEVKVVEWLKQKSTEDRAAVERLLDNFYTRAHLDKVKDLVHRTLLLEPMTPEIEPKRHIRLYLREATRCYIYGFWDSCVALSRAALDAALEDQVKKRDGSSLFESAHKSGRLDEAAYDAAKGVKNNGNATLHRGKHADEEAAGHTLIYLRIVIEHLYSRRPKLKS